MDHSHPSQPIVPRWLNSKWFFLVLSVIFASYLVTGTIKAMGFEPTDSAWEQFWGTAKSVLMFVSIWALGYACAAPDSSQQTPVLWKISTGAGHYYTDIPHHAKAHRDCVVAEYRELQ